MTAQQIYDNFHNAVGTVGLEEASNNITQVMRKYQDRSRLIGTVSKMMREGWTGDAADAASKSISHLAWSHVEAASAMNTASSLISSQTQAFHDTKNRVVPVPQTFMTPMTLGQQIFYDSSFLQTTQAAVANEAAKRNVEAMRAWTTTSGDNGSKMPTSYGTLDAGVLGVTQSSPSEVAVEHKPTSDGPRLGGPGGASRGGGGAVTGGTSSLSGPYRAPTGQAPADARTVAADAAYAPSSYNPLPPGSNPGSYGSSGGEGVPGYGSSAGYPGATPPGERFGAGAGRGGIASGRGFGPGAGGAGGRSGGAGRGFGPGSGGGGNSLTGGKRLGAASPAGAGESFARSGAAGRGGATSGPGAMGGGAGNRGKGEDDKDHQRKYIVDEDDHFQLTAEGEKAVDPITGLTVSPPVLGQ
ncbi:hypothetical protein [Amycolatopsis viridis]|uniref:PPE family domain-containing protein n=1 Tax=Amycolatopsis viridis TaxID=185678 RepID=A0ABX0SP30_9PSEU|nr:hypothetical protein [Amycolatopsis viridis]NIH78375.1 hypothetical protein [Amycolatopsis viridis]